MRGSVTTRSVLDQLGITISCTINQQTGLIDMLATNNRSSSSPSASSTTCSDCSGVFTAQNHSQNHSQNDNDKLIVFTDGACSNNGTSRAKAGYAVVWPNNRSLDTYHRLNGHEQTNNRAEYSALIEAQSIADKIEPTMQKPLYIYTDSELLVNSITKWLPGWKRNGWKKADKKPVLNQDLLKKIDENPRPLIFKHVRAHTGRSDWESIYNSEADRLARHAIGC
ncbi:ribonuclease H domain-containing protein [Dishui Lake large algae virus 1]|nr:ribonuclease H domain-containing protein [Dishui Lake large algae virus 1]